MACWSPKVSVVIGTYNRLRLLKIAVDSVRLDVAGLDHEIIVVDGGSGDGTLQWLAEQRDLISIVQHNRVLVDGKFVTRRSWGYFMNLGLRAATSDYILMLSDDCYLHRGAIEKSLRTVRERVEDGQRVGGVAYYFCNWPDEDDYYVQHTIGRRLMGNHGLFNRAALAEVGWIDADSYRFYKADGDLCLRLWAAGYRIIPGVECYVDHYLDPGESLRVSNNATMDADRRFYLERWGYLVKKGGLPEKVFTTGKPRDISTDEVFKGFRGAGTADVSTV